MTSTQLTLSAEQREILEFMAPAMGEGLTLAYDVAVGCGFPPRAAGQKLRALERRGWVIRRVAVERPSMRSDHLYGWEVTEQGWKALLKAERYFVIAQPALDAERFDAPGCQMCGAAEGDPCDCHDPQGD